MKFLFVLLGGIATTLLVKSAKGKPKVFVSYDHSEDAKYKRLLQAWDANPKFAFSFDSRGPDTPIESDDAKVIKTVLTKKMKESTHILVLVGKESHKSKWIKWEIERAKAADVNLKLVAVKLKKSYITPPGLLNTGTIWVTSFSRDKITAALKEA